MKSFFFLFFFNHSYPGIIKNLSIYLSQCILFFNLHTGTNCTLATQYLAEITVIKKIAKYLASLDKKHYFH